MQLEVSSTWANSPSPVVCTSPSATVPSSSLWYVNISGNIHADNTNQTIQNVAIAISTDIYDKLDHVGRVGGIIGITGLVREPLSISLLTQMP